MESTFIQDRITATEAMIVAYEAAIEALAVGGIQTYTLDTGQTRQTVTRMDLMDLQKTIDTLYNRCISLDYRLNGGNVSITRPAW